MDEAPQTVRDSSRHTPYAVLTCVVMPASATPRATQWLPYFRRIVAVSTGAQGLYMPLLILPPRGVGKPICMRRMRSRALLSGGRRGDMPCMVQP
jgi:hypothetical protein